MKVKSTQVGGSYTWFPEPYHAIRGEAMVTIAGNTQADVKEAQEEVTRLIVGQIEFIYEDVHEEIDTNINFQWLKDNVGKGENKADNIIIDEDDEYFEDVED